MRRCIGCIRYLLGSRRALAEALLESDEDTASFHSAQSSHVAPLQTRGSAEEVRQRSMLSDLERGLIAKLESALEAADWEEHSSSSSSVYNGGVEVHQRVCPGGAPGRERPLSMWRVRKELHGCSPQDVVETVLDLESQPKWHSHVTMARSLGTRDGATLVQTCFGGIAIVSAREALEHRAACRREPAREEYLVAFSSEAVRGDRVPVTKHHERSFTTLSGYRIAPGSRPDSVDFSIVVLIDPCGSLPDWVVHKVGPKGGLDYVRDLQRALDLKPKKLPSGASSPSMTASTASTAASSASTLGQAAPASGTAAGASSSPTGEAVRPAWLNNPLLALA
eukprot:TRINITY_DN38478_c0_g1_i1.p1 TRINITY_DN38478_c0_g1~~TRINITY_DN38478_c0_g1_i1.p1  ORF type:complete len:337 (+),score=59.26 TRINITY_DN38478_c0_g1_i1:101-1111(+)